MAPVTPDDGPVELVRVIRSGFHESTHYGSLVVVDADGEVVHARGAAAAAVFPRSSNKPFQAVAMLASGAPLADADLAISAASHSGEPMHTDRVQAMLDRVSLRESDLGCPVALPLDEAARDTVIASIRRIRCSCPFAIRWPGWPAKRHRRPASTDAERRSSRFR